MDSVRWDTGAVVSGAVGVVGGGIVGLAVAREVGLRRPGTAVLVFEKEGRVGAHQTGHNSGVVHAGIYYRPGSLKAELCTRGRLLLREYCAEHTIAYDERGKLVVAVDDSELGRLDALERSARDNGVPGLRRIDRHEITDIEPHVTGLAALHSPETAITDFPAVAEALAADVRAAGGEVLLGNAVTGVERLDGQVRPGGWQVRTAAGSHRVDQLVVCAGLQSDRVGRWVDGQDDPRIVPFRGEYLSVVPERRELVRGLVYPVPDPRYPFLGVHFTRRVTGELEIGPNAVLALAREGYRRTDRRWPDVRDLVTWPGSWRLATRHWRTGVRELRGSLSIAAYLRDAQRYVPDLDRADVVRGRCGVRAQAVGRDGALLDDFCIHRGEGVLTVRNAPSPAATSSLAIAEHVVDRLWEGSD
jgi:L-2-hydroxyglutarate oxidase LhgO